MVTNRKGSVVWKEESMKNVQANCGRKIYKKNCKWSYEEAVRDYLYLHEIVPHATVPLTPLSLTP